MDISTEENEAIVRRVYNSVTAAAEDRVMITPEQQNIYDVDYLVMKVNSGASFEQYFRWASVEEINRVVHALRVVRVQDTDFSLAVSYRVSSTHQSHHIIAQTELRYTTHAKGCCSGSSAACYPAW